MVYSQISSIIQEIRLETQYYEQIASKYHFFKKGSRTIDCSTAREWTKLDADMRINLIQLGHNARYSPELGPLPQEIIDESRVLASGSPVLGRHSFSHLPLESIDNQREEAAPSTILSFSNK